MRTFYQTNLSFLALVAPIIAMWHFEFWEYKDYTLSGEPVAPSTISIPFSSTIPATTATRTITITTAIRTITRTIATSSSGSNMTIASTNGTGIITTTRAKSSGSDMTMAITNVYGTQLSLSFGANAGGPSAVGNPEPTALANAASTQYSFPTGWAGRINVGPNLNPNGSKIEGSYTGPPDIDVSYVDGYSVPITCSSGGTAVSGCNIDLFMQQGIICTTQVDGPVCLNSAQNLPEGPAPPFFAACAGAAYTYPKDDGANVSNLGSNLVSCCIGTSCEAPSRQLPKQP